MDQNNNNYAPPTARVADPEPEKIIGRPKQIVVAVKLLWTVMILGSLVSLTNIFNLQASAKSHLLLRGLMIWVLVATFSVWIIRCVSAGKNWARIFKLITTSFNVVVLIAFAAIQNIRPEIYSQYFQSPNQQPAFAEAIGWFNMAILLVVMWLLFTKPGSDWFRRRS